MHTGRLSGAAAVLIENRAMKYGTGTNVLQVTVIELIDAAKYSVEAVAVQDG